MLFATIDCCGLPSNHSNTLAIVLVPMVVSVCFVVAVNIAV